MSLWNRIGEHIAQTTGTPFALTGSQSVTGGCINITHVIEGDKQRYFVKLNEPQLLEMFEAEAEGLTAMAATNTLRVPRPVCWGNNGNQAYLVMEHIETAASRPDTGAELGRQLAAMHRASHKQFGWHRDNTIGSTPQPNSPERDWVTFWREQRLGHQLALAEQGGHDGALQRSGRSVMDRLDELLDGHQPLPSLLHGDLWSGNHATDRAGKPFIFDPAVYYGDRETDIAMTELFGGYSRGFYDAYREAWPLDDGYPRRRTLYNLYHILNHLNLFGGGYGQQALDMMEQLLRP